MSEIEIAAPAPTPEPTTISAAVDAASRDDFAAFDAAHLSEKRGETAPRVEVKPAAPAEPERTLSKRQEAANDRTRAAVEQATADLRAENARLKALTESAAPRREEPAAPPIQKTPEWKRYMAMPDAPKLAEFDSVEEHAIAAALFINETRDRERSADASARHTDEQRAKFLTEHGQQYGDRLQKAKEADPDIASKIAPPLLQARPLSALAPTDARTFANCVAETALFSEDPAGLYVYLTAHPEEATKIASAQTEQQALHALARLDGRLTAGRVPATPAAVPSPAAETVARPSTITAAPPPVQTPAKTGVSTDPKASALARDDFAAFDRIDQQERAARRGHA